MDFLSKATAQLTDLFKSMTPGARITAGLLLAVIVVSLGFLFNHQVTSSDTFLLGGEAFPASQIPAMEAAFDKAGLTSYELVGNRVRVPKGQQSAYMGALADAGALPPDFGKFLEKAASSSPFVSKKQLEHLHKQALIQELQLVIRSMKGIERASVLYDIQEKRNFGAEQIVTASVSVKPVGSQLLDEERVNMVRHVMASAIAGLKPESVTVIDLNGRNYPAESATGGISGSGGGSLDRYATIKSKYEAHWQNQVAMALRFVPGVQVTANVELDPETSHTEDINLIDPKTVVYKQEETSRNKTSESGGPGGRPGLQGQQTANQSARVGSGESTRMNEEDSHTSTLSVVPSTVKKISQHGLTPKRVTVSVGVPSNYYTKIWNERNPPADGQPPKKPTDAEIQTIETKVKADLENTVVQLLPSPGTTVDPFPRVMVTTFQSLEEPPMPAETMQAQAMTLLAQHGNTVGMVLVALIALMVLRAMIRSAPSPEPAAAAEAPSPALSLITPDDEPSESESPTVKSRLKRRGPGGPSLRDELSELVKEDPDAAVSILRTWIGNPA